MIADKTVDEANEWQEKCWKKDLSSELRAEIQQGFDKVLERCLHEMRELLSPASNEAFGSDLDINLSCGMSYRGAHNRNELGLHNRNEGPPSRKTTGSTFTDLDPVRRSEKMPTVASGTSLEQSRTTEALNLDLRSWRGQIKSVIFHQETSWHTHLHQMVREMRSSMLDDDLANKRWMFRVIRGRVFNTVSLSAILLNAAWIGFEVDHQGEALKKGAWHQKVSWSFSAFFTLEILMRIIALRQHFIFGTEWAWNLLDAVLVVTSFPDFFESGGVNLSYFRLLRMAKISRAFRLVRFMKMFRNLREIMVSLVCTLGSLFWCFVALVMVSYMFALVFMQTVGFHIQVGHEFSQDTMRNFYSMRNTMMALFSFITGGQDWYDTALDFQRNKAHTAFYGLVFYIFFMVFGLLNVIIGVFCAKSTEATMENEDLRVSKEEEKRSKKVKELVQIFHLIDSQNRGFIQEAQFRKFVRQPRSRAMLESHGLQLFDMDKLWHIMDEYDGKADGSVDMPGFVMGVMRLSGQSAGTDLFMLSVQVGEIHRDLDRLFQIVARRIGTRKPSASDLPRSMAVKSLTSDLCHPGLNTEWTSDALHNSTESASDVASNARDDTKNFSL